MVKVVRRDRRRRRLLRGLRIQLPAVNDKVQEEEDEDEADRLRQCLRRGGAFAFPEHVVFEVMDSEVERVRAARARGFPRTRQRIKSPFDLHAWDEIDAMRRCPLRSTHSVLVTHILRALRRVAARGCRRHTNRH